MKTERTSALPPFYTQPIGSLPRPRVVLDLLEARGRLPPDRFQSAMDDMVRFAIRLQEQAGMDVVSDGEWRRRHYVGEFLQRVGGFEKCRRFEHQGEVKFTDVVVRRMSDEGPIFARDAEFLARHTDRCTKFALPSPFLIMIRYWHEDYSRDAYPTPRDFMDHLTELIGREARAVVAAGMDIVQIDDPALTYFCDARLTRGESIHDERLRRKWEIDRQVPEAVEAINRIVAGLAAEVHLHCCHSVYKRQSDVVGDYSPLLPRLANLRVDRVNLEFAYQGTGKADDLRLLPAGVGVGMGVVDVRGAAVQTVEEMAALGAAGAEAIGPDRIALNPDCGFAPDAGEPPTIDEAFEKLKRLCAAAAELRRRFSRPREPDRVRALRARAEAGDASAQYLLGCAYYEGGGVTRDYAEALKWYRLSAAQGNNSGLCDVGFCYRNGHGVEQDYAAALPYYRKACEQGCPTAAYWLAYAFEHGQGVERDAAKAVEHYRLAASRGDRDAVAALARLGER